MFGVVGVRGNGTCLDSIQTINRVIKNKFVYAQINTKIKQMNKHVYACKKGHPILQNCEQIIR